MKALTLLFDFSVCLFIYCCILQLTDEMRRYSNLFRACGMKGSCDLLDVLESIQRNHNQLSDAAVVRRDFAIARDILQTLAPTAAEEWDDKLRDRLLIPLHR